MTRKEFMAREIKEMRAAVGILEAYLKCAKRQHKTINTGNGCYDTVEYYTQQVMTHAANLRTMIDMGTPYAFELADGTMLMSRGGKDNNGGKRANIPVKYLNAVANNPDKDLTAEELKIRYMPMGKCGR